MPKFSFTARDRMLSVEATVLHSTPFVRGCLLVPALTQTLWIQARIIYHDLKPENIMLAADGHVRVVDFGLALAIDARQYDETRIGTSMYMAPELAKHRVQVCI